MPHLVITGASRRLGLYLTKAFLAKNWHVTAITRAPGEELMGINSSNLKILSVDYSKPVSLQKAVEQIEQSAVDLLFHNASYFAPDAQGFAENHDQLQQMLNTHIAMPNMLNLLLKDRLVRANNPNIIHMTDIYVDNPNPTFSNYCASKAGLENLSKSFAKTLAPNIRVNCIQPGALMFLPEHSEEAKKKVLSASLIPREAGFEPVLKTVLFLLDNPFITGTSIKVDGGRSICR